jgi:hypothetical protein
MGIRSVGQTCLAGGSLGNLESMPRWFAAFLAVAVVLLSANGEARKRRKKSRAVFDPDWSHAPSAKYANLTADACRSELAKRKIAFVPVAEARGVLAPVRISDGIDGVIYRTALPRKKGIDSPWEVFDCRLVLALADFTKILKQHHIDEVRIFSSWRPPRKSWPKGKLAKRHPGAMAVDVRRMRVVNKDAPSTWLNVKKHFGGAIGSRTCGPQAARPSPLTDEAKLLRSIVCEAAKQRIFTSILTPNHDRAHHNHFHFDLAPKVKWRIVR